MINEYTVKSFCNEDISKIENYDKAINSPEMWHCHHKMELIATGAVVDSSKQDLKDWGIYYNRPADELMFLTEAEHKGLHGRNMGAESRKKCGACNKGKCLSEETKRRMSEAKKGNTGNKGQHWKLVDGKRVYYKENK